MACGASRVAVSVSTFACCRPLSPLPPSTGVGKRLRLARRLPGENRCGGGPWHKASKAAAVECTRSSTTSVVHVGMAPECTIRCSFFARQHRASMAFHRHQVDGTGTLGTTTWRQGSGGSIAAAVRVFWSNPSAPDC